MEVNSCLSNRQKSKKPKGKGFWCPSCDMSLVWAGKKCKVCGKRNGKRREKP